MGQLTYSDRASELFKPPCRDNRDSKASRSSRAGKALEVHVQNDKTAALHNLISTAARGRATFPRTTRFCGRGGRPRPPATATQRDLRLIAVAGRPEVGPYLGLSKTSAARNRPTTRFRLIAVAGRRGRRPLPTL